MKVPFAVSEVIEPLDPTIKFCENSGNYVPLGQLLDHILNH